MVAVITEQLINYLNNVSKIIPLPWFTFIGSVVEEIIAPIPSPLVMTLAGSLAFSADLDYFYLFFLALTGAVGKTLASFGLYYLADKFEDVVLVKFGKYLGVSHKEVEQLGKHLNQGWKDDIAIFLLRAIPIIPSAPVSVVSGFIKVNTRTFIISTFVGTVVRNCIYLLIGYTGLNTTESILTIMEEYEYVGYILLGAVVMLILGYFIFQHKRDHIVSKFLKPKSINKDTSENTDDQKNGPQISL